MAVRVKRGVEGTVLLLEGRGRDQRRRKPWRDGAEPGTEEAHVTRGAERKEMDKEDLIGFAQIQIKSRFWELGLRLETELSH